MEEKYNKFIGSLEIDSITVPRLNWELFSLSSKDKKLFTNLNLLFEEPETVSENKVAIKANLEVNGLDEDKKKFMKIEILIKLVITFNPKFFDEDVLALYLNRNAIFSIMAIFREQVRYATFQMGLKPLILPALKILTKNSNANTQKTKMKKSE